MEHIIADFQKVTGPVKPMHSVNNGPVYKFNPDQRITNIEPYRAAGIPMARTHDASFYATYGGEHTVDVNMIFTDFDRDPDDPDAYDFVLTDEYLDMIEAGGAKPYYRLGSKIEHWQKKYNTLPPKDFHKWAVVCEHIIRHCNEGWANGKHRNITYWEIWNEPDLDAYATNKRTWGGTPEEFYELFGITYRHLKGCFPHLKIGGPACCGLDETWLNGFFSSLGDIRPDFFSWHVYAKDVESVQHCIRRARAFLDQYGLSETESILNEWNYVRGWESDEWLYSLRAEKSLKGSAFTAATMLMSQDEPLDHLMYYDARPCGMNGLFATDYVCDCLKGYYPFWMFNQLYRQGTAVETKTTGNGIWAAAAKGEEQNIMLSYYDENDEAPAKEVKVTFQNVDNPNGVRLEYYCLDGEHDAALVREEIFTAATFSAYLTMPLHSTWLLRAVPVKAN